MQTIYKWTQTEVAPTPPCARKSESVAMLPIDQQWDRDISTQSLSQTMKNCIILLL